MIKSQITQKVTSSTSVPDLGKFKQNMYSAPISELDDEGDEGEMMQEDVPDDDQE